MGAESAFQHHPTPNPVPRRMNLTNRAQLVSFAAIAALSMFNAAARADDGGGAYDFPPALVADSGMRYESDAPTTTCADAKSDAWFLRQMALTDGDGDPTVAPVECRPEGELIAANSSEGE